MADFPVLRTGAVAQYPSDRVVERTSTTVRFVDGAEQRWRETGSGGLRWVLRFSALDDSEAATLASFFEAQGGRAGHFSIEDPWTGKLHDDCSFDQDTLSLEFRDTGAAATVAIRENR
jgi:hypothetical protein